MASSRERHPTLGGGAKSKGDALIDFRNNVIYNLSGATNLANCRINFINNYYRPGPNASNRLPVSTKIDVDGVTEVYMAGNVSKGTRRPAPTTIKQSISSTGPTAITVARRSTRSAPKPNSKKATLARDAVRGAGL